jgi:hypothetical protein
VKENGHYASNKGSTEMRKILLILCCILNDSPTNLQIIKQKAAVEISNELFIYSSTFFNIKHVNMLAQKIRLKVPLCSMYLHGAKTQKNNIILTPP